MTSVDEHQARARQLARDITDSIAKNGEQHSGVIVAALALVSLRLVATGNDFHELKDAIEMKDSAT
jgi:hypothetical protein